MMFLRTLFFALCLSACATPRADRPASGSRMEFSLPDASGAVVTPAEYAGRVVLVDLWATWCAPCEASFPFYTDLHQRYRDQGFEILAVSVDREDEDVRAFLERMKVPFRILRDPEGTLPESLAIDTMPTAFLLDRSGNIAFVHPGFRDGDEVTLEDRVKAALAEAAP